MKGRLVVIATCAALCAVALALPWALNALFDLFDLAFGWAGGFAVVTLISAGVGILFLLAFPHVSSQRGIKAVKDRIKHNLLAIRVFQDDLRTVAKATGSMFLWNFGYIALNLLPMVVLAAPFMIVWFQLNALYAYAPLKPGAEQVVVAELSAGTAPHEVAVEFPEAVGEVQRVDIADPRSPRVLLRLRPETAGDFDLTLVHGDETVTKTLAVGETEHRRLARLRTSEPFARFAAAEDPIVMFGEPVLPGDSFVRTVTVDYPPAPLGFLDGGEISVMIWFVVVSLAVGFGLKGAFGVEI